MNNLPLPEELIEIIRDYAVGDTEYWKTHYDGVEADIYENCIILDNDKPNLTPDNWRMADDYRCNYLFSQHQIKENLKISQYEDWGISLWQRRQWQQCPEPNTYD